MFTGYFLNYQALISTNDYWKSTIQKIPSDDRFIKLGAYPSGFGIHMWSRFVNSVTGFVSGQGRGNQEEQISYLLLYRDFIWGGGRKCCITHRWHNTVCTWNKRGCSGISNCSVGLEHKEISIWGKREPYDVPYSWVITYISQIVL